MIALGRRVEIRPAYNSDTGEQDIWDEIAGCSGHVVGYGRDGSGEHRVVLLDGEEVWASRGQGQSMTLCRFTRLTRRCIGGKVERLRDE